MSTPHPRGGARLLLRAAATLLLASTLATGGAAQGGFDPMSTILRRADASGDGTVDAGEWTAFLDGLVDEDGKVDRAVVKARTLARDIDKDGEVTVIDLEQAFGDWRAGGMLGFVAGALADRDGDGQASDEEKALFVEETALEGEVLTIERLVVWVRTAEAMPPPADPNAFTPGVYLLTIDSALDENLDGVLDRDDLEAHFARVDKNGDGSLSAEELSPGRGGSGGAAAADDRWKVTEEDKQRPPLMPWQRSLEDALALQRRTGKPLLLCVNMDDENASESLAWKRYRDPAFVELVQGFIPLLASPDRHTARDRDDRGRRVEDPRFGRLACSEHVDIEPQLYERWFQGTRAAPRHIGVSAEGEILFDVYLVDDLVAVDEKLREFGQAGEPAPAPESRTEAELLDSPDAADRSELERRFVLAEEGARVRLAQVALSSVRETQHPELLRLALRDPSEAVRREGLWTLVRHPEAAPEELFPVAYERVRDDAEMTTTVLAAIRRGVEAAGAAGDTGRRDALDFYGRSLASLGRTSAVVDVARWRLALELAPPLPEEGPDEEALIDHLDALERVRRDRPEDVDLLIDEAVSRMQLGLASIQNGGNPTFFFQDALASCERALELVPTDGRALGANAWASYYLGDPDTAVQLAERAIPRLLRDADSRLAGEVLGILATLRRNALYTKMAAGETWSQDLAADALAAGEARLFHPLATEADWTAQLDLLGSLAAYGEQADLLRLALAKDPVSGTLQSYLRFQVLRDGGSRALEATYLEGPLARVKEEDAAGVAWFHGLATLFAAEHDVQNGHDEAARQTYRRALERFQRSRALQADYGDSAAHYESLSLAGLARLDSDAGRYDEAVEHIVEAVRRAPASVDAPDGLGKTPGETARALKSALDREGETNLAGGLTTLLAEAGLTIAPPRSMPKHQ